MTGWLSTHVLDTALGKPARGLRLELWRFDGAQREQIAEAVTNEDGRTNTPILPEEAFVPGEYELVFQAGDYLRATKQPDGFLGVIPIRFSMTEASHYHVPLLLSPFGYSTYRGS